jgi:hypothetical protein
VEKYDTAREVIHDNKTPRMRFASWTTNATNTHSEYDIRITFPPQQWLRERASILRYMNASSNDIARPNLIFVAPVIRWPFTVMTKSE